ncbi:type VII secretion system-associated protein [Streptomyces sp. M10(2022)]
MNEAWINNFIEQEVTPFRAAILAMKNPAGDVPAVRQLVADESGTYPDNFPKGGTVPLSIGKMTEDNQIGGSNVLAATNGLVTELIGIFESQETLFDELLDNLRATAKKLKETQGSNLEMIDGAEFLDDIFDDVEDALTGGGEEDK